MAYRNKVIRNPAVGHIKFLQTGNDTEGKLLEMEATYKPGSKEPPQHYHPFQEEDFTIIKGQMTVRIDGTINVLQQGDTLHIPSKKSHSMWNDSDTESVVNWKVRPALTTEYLLEAFAGLAGDREANKKGIPKLLQVASIANKYRNVFRLSKPPYIIQKIGFSILALVAHVAR